MRVLHIAYQQLRRYGHTRVSWSDKLTNGLIKNDHWVHVFSDRDVAAFEAPFGIRDLGKGKANKRLVETFEACDPDLVIAGHSDIISNKTLVLLKELKPSVVIVDCNNDPLFVPENVERIKKRAEVVDAIFVSTGRRELNIFNNGRVRIYHMPNPVDPAIECLNNSKKDDLSIDLLFCSNSDNFTDRLNDVDTLKKKLDGNINFQTFGSFGTPPVWGRDYDSVLAQTKMGLNFNRQEGFYWYSSARMAQLGGNGILPFTHSSNRFDDLFPPESIPYFKDQEELLGLINEFFQDDAKRKTWAANAYSFFHKELNNRLYGQYILEAALMIPFSYDYVWASDINQDGSLK